MTLLLALLLIGAPAGPVAVARGQAQAAGEGSPRGLALAEIRQRLADSSPDAVIASEIAERGIGFSVDDAVLRDLKGRGAGPQTLRRLAALQPKGAILVKVGLPGATVHVGGIVAGTTGADGNLRIVLPEGDRRVVVTKEEYLDSPPVSVAVKAGQEELVSAVLEIRPVRTGIGGIAPPRKVKDRKPAYPPLARAHRVQGRVVVELTTNLDGSVREARVVRSIPLLDAAALEAVKQWQYEPLVLRGMPRPAIINDVVEFTLE